MTTGQNYNHPKKGSIIRVEPITSIEDIQRIKNYLADSPRNLAIFIVGINTNLRASDLTKITIGQVKDLKPMDVLTLREKKTGKVRKINLNAACIRAIQGYLDTIRAGDDEPLFDITVPSLSRLVKGWCREIGLDGNYAGHSLRKTFARIHYFEFGTKIATLMTMLNHSSPAMTLKYIGVQPEEVEAAYEREI